MYSFYKDFLLLTRLIFSSHKQQQELDQSSHKKSLDDKNSTSEISLITQSSIIQEYVQFSVYGIREPGEEIKVELVKLITKKLDQTTLDILNQSLARNPKSKLTPQDVEVRNIGLRCCQLHIKDTIKHLRWRLMQK